ncbi:MAG: hypothetical protein KKH99_07380, partial [Proteobacteria bacterium]|nr:hypothetical protein [Pseudomonadota bacterium]
MTAKKSMVTIFPVFCFFLLFACSGLQTPSITKNYFDLNMHTQGPKNHGLIRQGQILLIKELSIASEFDSHSFVYRMDEFKYTTDFYNEFVAYPAGLITEKISEKLYHSEYFSPFLARRQQDISFRLFGKITALYGDMQNRKSPEAVMGIRLILEKKTGDTFTKIFARTYQFREMLSSFEPEQLAAGWSKGLDTITSDFINDLAQQGLIN